MKYRLMKNLPKCLRGRLLEPVCLGKSYIVVLTKQEQELGSVKVYSWPKVDVESNPHWFQPVDENEDENVAKIWEHQSNPMFHPLTCGTDSKHALLTPMVNVDGDIVLVCDDCSYHQIFVTNDKEEDE